MRFKLFSDRERERLGTDKIDVLQYDCLPNTFRNQIIHILDAMLGRYYSSYEGSEVRSYWNFMFNTYAKEKGWNQLLYRSMNPQTILCEFFVTSNVVDALDFIDLCFYWGGFFRQQEEYQNDTQNQRNNIDRFDEAFEELNDRFRHHAIGFELCNSKLVRVDSQLIHSEAVRPALNLMYDAGAAFSGPLQEFVEAHGKYREGDYKDAIVAACRSLESVLKTICTLKGWAFDPNKDSSARLVSIVFANNLIPAYLQTQFDSLRSLLESGVSTIRNKTSGHGQGSVPQEVPNYLVSYAMHLAATNIIFLVRAFNAHNLKNETLG